MRAALRSLRGDAWLASTVTAGEPSRGALSRGPRLARTVAVTSMVACGRARMIPFEKILVTTDFGPSSERAIAVAIELAELHGAELTLLHVWDVPSYAYSGMELAADDLLSPLRDRAQAMLDRALHAVQAHVPDASCMLRCGDAWKEIDEAIRGVAPDLVVMGGRHGHGIARAILGSVTEKVIRSSAVPVLTVHATTGDRARGALGLPRPIELA